MRFQKSIIVLLLLIIIGCASNIEKNGSLTPATVVELYFKAWNLQDYETMYRLISDGFKTIEPSAKTIDDFTTYAKAQGITTVKIDSIQEKSNDGITAGVYYKVRFVTQNKEVPFEGTFTLKYRANDGVPGWKLIHPYGTNVDLSP
ncbi:nuclear transport factor 2 family protein [Candidatus Woesearchaeota archaeon]|nr:nuclear transport factor 2 family protein [Candidatus Woesearchaeota archaeon]